MNFNMKKVLLYSAFALGTLTMSTGCGDNFLEITPVSSTSLQTLSDAQGIDYLLTGAYSTLNNMISSAGGMGESSLSNWVWGDIVGADANKGSTAGDQSDLTQLEVWAWSASNGYIKNRWDAVYESIKRANVVISLANKMDDAALPNKADIIAQAKFLKGFWLFDGIRIFGPAIPYVSVEDYEASTDPQVSNVDENGNYIYIWDKAEQYLKEAAAALPATRTEGNYGRATSWQAKAVLAKLYLYWSSPYNGTTKQQDKWAECKALLDEIIASGVDAKGKKFCLAETYHQLWDINTSDWSGESVFDIQYTISGTQYHTNAWSHQWATGNPGGMGIGGWGFYQPTYEFVNSYIVDENGLPLPTAEYQALPALTPPVSSNPQTDLATFTDPRLDMNVGRFGVPFFDYGTPTQLNGWVRDYTNGGMYMNKKMLPKKADRGGSALSTYAVSSAINYHIIRFADILLMRAEVALHDGDLEKCREYINMIRTRAANGYVAADATTNGSYKLENKVTGEVIEGTAANYRMGIYTQPFASADAARIALEREIRLEFGMEGHRWFDIARWGKVAEVLNNFASHETKYLSKYANTYDSKWVCMPIPDSEIKTAMGRFVQTENWK